MRTRALLAAVAAVPVLALLPVAPSSAGVVGGIQVLVTPTTERDLATFTFVFEVTGAPCIGNVEATVLEDGVTEIDATVDVGEGTGTIVVGADVPGGFYDLVLSCETDGGPAQGTDDFAFARGFVVKEVEGTVPSGTEFAIDVDCEGEDDLDILEGVDAAAVFGLTFVYPAAGGEDFFVVYNSQACEVTESQDGGADSTTVEGTFTFPDAVDETVVVTNTFVAAEVVEPPAAQPVAAAPDFTG